MKKAYFNWSSGKDSSLALYHAIQSKEFEIETLFTTVNMGRERISMHEISTELLKRQAEAIGIPLTIFTFSPQWTREVYSLAMQKQMECFKEQNITTSLFGDLYLEELRKSREENCRYVGMKAEFPLWGIPGKKVMAELVHLGFKAIITCVDHSVLPETFVGRIIDETFMEDLPPNVDPCGENGEYHSFVFDGPIFHHPVDLKVIGKYYRDYPEPESGGVHRYWYLELE